MPRNRNKRERERTVSLLLLLLFYLYPWYKNSVYTFRFLYFSPKNLDSFVVSIMMAFCVNNSVTLGD